MSGYDRERAWELQGYIDLEAYDAVSMTAYERLEAALRRCCDETDYCYVCDNHPSHGHAEDCPLREVPGG